jgi:hypothetical protein
MERNFFKKRRISRMVALGLSIIMMLNPIATSAQGVMGNNYEESNVLMVSTGDASGGDASGGNTSGGDIPGGNIPGGDIPGGNIPGGNISGGDIPGGYISGGDASGGDASGGDASGGNAISVYFPDDNLEAAVRSALTDVSAGDVVTTAQLSQITYLGVGAVKDWTGIELLTNIEFVNMIPRGSYDITNLAGLSKIKKEFAFNIGEWDVEPEANSQTTGNISVFSDLTNLNCISFAPGVNVYGALSSFSELTELEELTIEPSDESYNITGKISDFSKLTKLTRLMMDYVAPSGTYSELGSFTNLIELNVSCGNITGSLGDLKSLSKLEHLNLGSNTFNLNELTGILPNLNFLSLNGKIAGSLDTLGTWENLTEIGLWDWGIEGEPPSTLTGDIKYFAKYPNLEVLNLLNIPVSGKISSLADLENLDYYIEGTNVIFDDYAGTVQELFPDANLAAAVAAALECDVADPVSLTPLRYINDLYVDAVKDWTGIERLINLGYINVFPTEAYDISYLAGLLKTNNTLWLDMGSWEVEPEENSHITGDISVFSDVTNINGLTFCNGAKVYGELSSLSNLTSLEELNFMATEESFNITGKITDLSRLTGLTRLKLSWVAPSGTYSDFSSFTNLEELYVSCGNITGSIGDLKSLSKLEHLNLGANTFNINELSGGFPNLRYLFLDGKIAGSLDTLGTWENLTEIGLWDWGIEGEPPSTLTGDIKYFAKYPNLEFLNLLNLPVSGKISSLAGLENLYDLFIDGTDVIFDDYAGTVKELFPDANLAAAVAAALGCDVTDPVSPTQLRYIGGLKIDAVTNWTGMDYLTGLYEIKVLPSVEYDIANLAPLKSYTQIGNFVLGVGDWEEEYDKNQNIVGKISVFSDMTNLKGLFVESGTNLSGSLSDLSNLTGLEQICFKNRDGGNLSGSLNDLQNMKNLWEIRLMGNQITGNTSSLKNFPNLQILDINNTSITGTLSDISSVEKLNQLWIFGTGIEGDIKVLSGFTAMEYISLKENEKLEGDTSALSNMTNLRCVDIGGTGIISAIKDFTNCNALEELYLWAPVTGNLSDLGEKDKLSSMWLETTVYTKPADKDLFPNLVDYDSNIFIESTLDEEGSNLTYYKDQFIDQYDSEFDIRIRTNKFPYNVVGVKVDGIEVPMGNDEVEGYYHMWEEVPEGTDPTVGWIMFNGGFLYALEAGEHTFELDIPQGGPVSGTFTVIETANGTIAEEFQDAELAKAVAAALEMEVTDTASSEQLRSIWRLTIGTAVTNWTGADKLTGLFEVEVLPTSEFNISSLISLPQIHSVRLGNDRWDEIPAENQLIKGDISVLAQMTNLEQVSIGSGTKLTGSLSSLKDVDLRSIQIGIQEGEGITGSLEDLSGMEQLGAINLRGDKITGLTSHLQQLSGLEYLNLDNTKVTGSLSELAGIKGLKELHIKGTGISGDIYALRDLDKMENLDLGENEELTGYTSNLSNMKELVNVNIYQTNIRATIKDFAGFDKLESLHLWGQVTGKLSDLGSKEYLTRLFFESAVYTSSADKSLFPSLVDYEEKIFTDSVLDNEGSNLEFYKDVYEDSKSIRLRTNKSLGDIVAVFVDGNEVFMVTEEVMGYYHDWDDPEGSYISGCIVLQAGFVETLSAGTHTFTLEIPQGGSVSGTFTVIESAIGTIAEEFPNAELAKAVAAAIGGEVTDSATQNNLRWINELYVDAVTDWTGIELLPNLHQVMIRPSKSYNISNLAGLSKTQNELWLTIGDWEADPDNNKLIYGDLSVFSGLTKLKGITITSDTKVKGSLSSLSELTSLEVLTLTPPDHSYITGDLSDLAKLTRLSGLALGLIRPTGEYSDISIFVNLINLNLSCENMTGSIGDLKSLSQMISLNLGGNTFNLSELSGGMPNLEKLIFVGETTGSLDDLSSWSKLTSFQLFDWGMTSTLTGDIKYFAGSPNLEILDLLCQPVSGEISSLASLSKLHTLSLDATNVEGDIKAFSNMTSIKNLTLIGDGFTGEIGSLSGLNDLETLAVMSMNTEGKLSDLGEKSKLVGIGIFGTISSVPTDQALFPSLDTNEMMMNSDSRIGDLFTAPELDEANSNLTYYKGTADSKLIFRSGNKSPNTMWGFYVDGEGITDETEDETRYWGPVLDQGSLMGSVTVYPAYLDTLEPGEYGYKLYYHWGGFLEGTFTVVDNSVKTWTVTFEDGSGNEIGKVVVADGGTVVAPAIPNKDGYTFAGWDKDLTNIKADTTITAQFAINYTVTFKDGDGNVIDEQQVVEGGSATAPEEPARVGYKFTKWDVEFNNVTKNLVVTALYQEILFTVTFVDEGGTVLKEQKVAYGKPATAPEVPAREGYEFTGWDKGFASITADITIIAKYREIRDSSYEINKPGTVDGTTLEEFGEIIIKSEGVTLIGGNLDGNVRVEAAKAVLQNLTIAGSVYLSAKDTTMTDSTVEGSLSALAESISLQNLKIGGNLSIGATDISLKGGTIGGNLTIERSVGNGRVEISGVTAKETIMYVHGGGSNSIIIADSELGAIVVDKPDTAGDEVVRISVQGTTEVANVIVNNAAIIEDTTTAKDTGIQNVTLAPEIPVNKTVELRGVIKEVTVLKEDLKVVNNAAVEKLQVEVTSLTLVNNESVAELKLEKEAVNTKVEGNKVETTNVATGGAEPVYIFIPGDPTGDGTVNIFDIMAVRNVIFGTAKLTGSAFTAADLDGKKDGLLNIFDIMAIRNIIFG